MKGVWATLITVTMLIGTASVPAQEITPPLTRPSVVEQPAFPAPIKDDCCAEARQKMADLEKKLNQLRNKVDKQNKDIATLTDGLSDTQKAILTLTNGLGSTQQIVQTHDVVIKDHSTEIAALKTDLSDLRAKFLQSARFDPESNRYVPNILGNMQVSRTLRQEMGTSTQGRVVLHNETGNVGYVTITGVRWRVLPGRSYVNVPRRLVVVQRPGFSEDKVNTWTLDDQGQGYLVEYSLTYGPIVSPDYH